MKRITKSALCFVLTALLLFSVLPFAASAAPLEETEAIVYFDTTMEAGDSPDYSPYVYSYDEDWNYTISSVGYVYVDEEGNSLSNVPETAVFQPGDRFMVVVYLNVLDADNEPYILTNSEVPRVFFEDAEADVVCVNPQTNAVMATVTYQLKNDHFAVPAVCLSDIREPIAGQHPDYEISREYNHAPLGYEYDYNYNENCINGITWYDTAAGTPMTESDTFVEGRSYTFCIGIKTVDTCWFVYEGDDATVFTLNGEAIEPTMTTSASAVTLQKTFTCVSGDPYTLIDTVELETPELVAGQHAPFEVTIKTPGVKVEKVSRYRIDRNIDFYDGIAYTRTQMPGEEDYDFMNPPVITPDDTLDRNQTYSMHVCLTVEDGYEFNCESHGVKQDTHITVNGENAFFAYTTTHDDWGKYIIVQYQMTTGELPPEDIQQVDVYSLQTPIAGRTPDYYARCAEFQHEDEFNVYYLYWEVGDPTYSQNGITWYDNDNHGAPLATNDTFIKGHSYTVQILLGADFQYLFNCDEDDPARNTVFKINHRPADEAYCYYDTNDVAVMKKTFTCVEGDPVKYIDEVYITTPQPVGGQTAPFTATVTTEGVSIEPYTAGLAGSDTIPYWFDGISYIPSVKPSYPLSKDDLIVAGEDYRFSVLLQAADGYEFPVDEENEVTTKIYINGIEAEVLGNVDPMKFCGAYATLTAEQPTTIVGYPINVTLTEPVAGQHPNSNATVTEGVRLTGNFRVMWEELNAEGNYVLMEGDAFVEGKQYRANVVMEPAYGYAFDTTAPKPIVRFNKRAAVAGFTVSTENILATRVYVARNSQQPPKKIGDINGSSAVDNTDAVLLKRYVMGWKNVVIDDPNVADLNGDGKVDNTDAVILKRCVMGWEGYRQQYLGED